MTTTEILQAARALYAAAPSHAPANTMPSRHTYCPITAIAEAEDAAAECSLYRPAVERFERAIPESSRYTVASFNADHSTQEVLAVFDAAIEAAA